LRVAARHEFADGLVVDKHSGGARRGEREPPSIEADDVGSARARAERGLRAIDA
jgi:hypothetical protein